MKKPPYRSYKSRKSKEPAVHIPEKIDTPQAEQLASDLSKVISFISKHKSKLLMVLAFLLIIGGSYGGFTLYKGKMELKAAQVVDKGLFYLREGKREEALKYLNEAAKEYPKTPSGKVALFLIAKLEGKREYLKELASSKSYLFSPPSKTSLDAEDVDRGKTLEYTLKREEWTHPEYLYYKLLIDLKKGERQKAKQVLDSLTGDYGNLPISTIAKRLME
ncbi:tetratricopeptide repeat protein [Thermovibrio sp.]